MVTLLLSVHVAFLLLTNIFAEVTLSPCTEVFLYGVAIMTHARIEKAKSITIDYICTKRT